MNHTRKMVILYNEIGPDAGPDELDVLTQVDQVKEAGLNLGYDCHCIPFSLDLPSVKKKLSAIYPDIVFNLVESVNNCGQLIHLAPSLLQYMNLPYTGARLEAMFLTTQKVLAKQQMTLSGILTPPWSILSKNKVSHSIIDQKKYIVKPVWEEGSLGLDEDSVILGKELKQKFLPFSQKAAKSTVDLFIEEYIDGREFNVSILGSLCGPVVLPPAEILFQHYPVDKPKVVGFKAKWDSSSFEFQNTPRNFQFPLSEKPLLDHIRNISKKVWKLFQLKGYARVDIRVDSEGNPYILEVNANPCLSADGGFFAACQEAGIVFHDVIRRIIEDIEV